MVVLAACLLAAAAYARGTVALWQHAGQGRGLKPWQVLCFGGALTATVAALESTLDALAANLFAAHMVQHVVLILVVAPLTVLGAPLPAFAWALPSQSRHRLTVLRPLRRLAAMPTAFALHSLALWAWHLPLLYDAAVAQPAVHVLEHVCFLVTAVCFWWAVLSSSYLTGVLAVFAMALETTVLGALLTFADQPWYTAHLATTAPYGLTPREDQQLAGLIMWLPGGAIYLGSALALFAAWLKHSTPESAPSATIPKH